ncbi:hypothetical protein E2C01_080264 [Portunus trituberculatus]|uniref:Uncharacterized protein n=1 Tax=Portunus trituberculatus TaxID=210409 RepID=A0A5B7IUY8_PORTR|nr:hypothetical protein [Portunus trituberculatus]
MQRRGISKYSPKLPLFLPQKLERRDESQDRRRDGTRSSVHPGGRRGCPLEDLRGQSVQEDTTLGYYQGRPHAVPGRAHR